MELKNFTYQKRLTIIEFIATIRFTTNHSEEGTHRILSKISNETAQKSNLHPITHTRLKR